MTDNQTPDKPQVQYAESDDGTLVLRFSGEWQMTRQDLPPLGRLPALLKKKTKQPVQQVRLELAEVTRWDSSLLSELYVLLKTTNRKNLPCEWHGDQQGVQALVEKALSRKVKEPREEAEDLPVLETLGTKALSAREAADNVLEFTGEVVLSLGRMIRGKAYFRGVDFAETLANGGPRALPIITLISFLVGLILAFVGSMQLEEFGAQIFVANLVGIAMAREMGAMMSAIIMAGRTSAAYAAQIGSMQVNEELDAMRTASIQPIDFLTLPRVLTMLISMPILCLYADVIGILGGMAIGVFMLDLSPVAYWQQTVEAISLNDFAAGFMKSIVFAFVVAMAGCYHGMRCGRNSAAVGKATTRAVVSAIVLIIITDSILTVLYDILNF